MDVIYLVEVEGTANAEAIKDEIANSNYSIGHVIMAILEE